MPDAAPNGGNQRRTSVHSTNAAVVCTIIEGVPRMDAATERPHFVVLPVPNVWSISDLTGCINREHNTMLAHEVAIKIMNVSLSILVNVDAIERNLICELFRSGNGVNLIVVPRFAPPIEHGVGDALAKLGFVVGQPFDAGLDLVEALLLERHTVVFRNNGATKRRSRRQLHRGIPHVAFLMPYHASQDCVIEGLEMSRHMYLAGNNISSDNPSQATFNLANWLATSVDGLDYRLIVVAWQAESWPVTYPLGPSGGCSMLAVTGATLLVANQSDRTNRKRNDGGPKDDGKDISDIPLSAFAIDEPAKGADQNPS